MYNAAGGVPMYILSAEHGLIEAHQRLLPYQRVMDDERAHHLASQAAEVMRKYDWFVFFKGGSRSAYALCMRLASSMSGVPLVLVGYANMGHFRECITIALELRDSGKITTTAGSLEVYRPVLRRIAP